MPTNTAEASFNTQLAELRLIIGHMSTRIRGLEDELALCTSKKEFAQLKEENQYLSTQMDLMQKQIDTPSPFPYSPTQLELPSVDSESVGAAFVNYYSTRRATI